MKKDPNQNYQLKVTEGKFLNYDLIKIVRKMIIEKVTPNTELLRLEREEFWIRKFSTKIPFGLNVLD